MKFETTDGTAAAAITTTDRLDAIASLSRAIKPLSRGDDTRTLARVIGEIQVTMSTIGVFTLDTEDNTLTRAKRAARG